MLVDSHCHLNYLDTPEACLAAARAAQVEAFLCIGVDQPGIAQVLALAEAHADVWATVGQHPDATAAPVDWIEPLLGHERVVAVGETGLDYAHDPDAALRSLQCERFEFQLALAARHRLPVVVHTRGAEADTLALLRGAGRVTGVLHCFTESWDLAAAALELGFYISISGIVTFRNGENVREVARRVPADRLLVETDSPWLAPVPFRGKPNQPAHVIETARCIAGLRDCSLEQLAAETTDNFYRLFARSVRSESLPFGC